MTVSGLTTLLGGTIAFDQSGGGAVSFTVVSTGASAVEVESDMTLTNTGGDLTVGTSVTALGLGNIVLTTLTAGSVILTGTTTADADQVTVTSVGSINGNGLVTASVADLNAATGIGNTTTVQTSVAVLDIDNATSGNIDISETDAVTVVHAHQDDRRKHPDHRGWCDHGGQRGPASNAVIAVGAGTITLKNDGAGSGIAVNSGV